MKLQKLAALGGIISPVLFAGVVTILTIVQYDFMRDLGWIRYMRLPSTGPAGCPWGRMASG